jgi:hypothetical protein
MIGLGRIYEGIQMFQEIIDVVKMGQDSPIGRGDLRGQLLSTTLFHLLSDRRVTFRRAGERHDVSSGRSRHCSTVLEEAWFEMIVRGPG